MSKPRRICIDARVDQATAGGIQQFVIGLAHGLSQLPAGAEEYYFLVEPTHADWLAPYLSGACQLLVKPPAPRPPLWRRIWRRLRGQVQSYPTAVPISDGFIESQGMELIHFTTQNGFLTSVPSIYHPHDLQHCHYPHYFSAAALAYRELFYRTLSQQAQVVAVGTTWIQQDVVTQFGLPSEKVAVVPLAPPVAAYPVPSAQDLEMMQAKLQGHQPFIYYPAQTWQHKNHINLLRALAYLRDEKGQCLHLVLSGHQNAYYQEILKEIKRLNLESQVIALGYVTPLELQSLYRLCEAVVIPTRFEAESLPVWEAFIVGAAVVCSNITSMPVQVQDAGLLFDPDDIPGMATAIETVWHDKSLRAQLIEKGRQRVADFTWVKTAAHFRAHYRRLLGESLPEADKLALIKPPLL